MRSLISVCAAVVVVVSMQTTVAVRAAEEVTIPLLFPITGILALEGGSQRNGALLAVENPPEGVKVNYEVVDTGSSAKGAATALEKVLSGSNVTAVGASIFGTEMLAMMPIALDYKVPLVTMSGTAKITELGNPYVLRFFPSDAVVKVAHASYAVEELGKTRPAIIFNSTAYGQSGREHLVKNFKKLGIEPVFEEGLDVKVKDMLPVLSRAVEANPDVLIIHMHSGKAALLVKQALAMGLGLPIVSGSTMHQPTTAALLEPSELKGVCAESGSSPVSGGTPELEAWLAEYRAAYDSEPDAFGLGQYDGLMMVLEAIKNGARTAEDVRHALSSMTYEGLAMTYKSDGNGNFAHSAVIVCYDGTSRIPKIVKRYENITGVL